MEYVTLRRYRDGDEYAVSEVICTTLAISNSEDYPPEMISESIRSHSPELTAKAAGNAHFYVACVGDSIIGCGGITDYWGSEEESYLTSVFVLPHYQGRGVGRKIINALEADEYFLRARRTEVGASLTAVPFYLKMGYEFKNDNSLPDEFGAVRMQKRRKY